MPITDGDRDVVEVVSAVLATHGCFPIRVCSTEPHDHPTKQGLALPCHSLGKRPLDSKWSEGSTADMSRLMGWLDAGHNIGIVPTDGVIGIDEDVPGGLDLFFARVGEEVPVTLGDVVPATGKRHIFVKLPEGTDAQTLPGVFGDGNGVRFGELARAGARQFVAPGCSWVSSDGETHSHREWNGEHRLATLSLAAVQALLTGDIASINPVGWARETQGSEWQWQESMGSRHDLLVREARRLAGSIRDADDLTNVLWKWGQSHGLTGLHPSTGRNTDQSEVREAAQSAIAKFSEDPAPITLLVPKAGELVALQAVAAQQRVFETLETLPYGATPKPLVLDMFVAPEGWTVLYANGGTGKGFLALWMLHQYLVANPEKRAMVLDYEGHKWEWGNRARNMGWSQQERERVIYIDPYDPVWKKGHTLRGLAPALRPHVDTEDVGLVIVDSYSTAAGTGSEMGGLEGAVDFFKAAAALGAPGLVLAHTSSEDRFPKRPFGSVFIHNLARETWAGAQIDVNQNLPVKGQFAVTETVMQVELRNQKRSVGERTNAGQVFDIGFRSTGVVTVNYVQTYQRPLRDLVADVLSASATAMTAKQVSAAIREDYDRDVSEESIRKVIDRGIDRLVEDATRRPKTYSLDEEPGD